MFRCVSGEYVLPYRLIIPGISGANILDANTNRQPGRRNKRERYIRPPQPDWQGLISLLKVLVSSRSYAEGSVSFESGLGPLNSPPENPPLQAQAENKGTGSQFGFCALIAAWSADSPMFQSAAAEVCAGTPRMRIWGQTRCLWIPSRSTSGRRICMIETGRRVGRHVDAAEDGRAPDRRCFLERVGGSAGILARPQPVNVRAAHLRDPNGS